MCRIRDDLIAIGCAVLVSLASPALSLYRQIWVKGRGASPMYECGDAMIIKRPLPAQNYSVIMEGKGFHNMK